MRKEQGKMSNHIDGITGKMDTTKTEPFRYAVIDLAIAKGLRTGIAGLLPTAAEPLLAHKFPQDLLMVGPWLVRLSKAPAIKETLSEMAADVPWGYYVHSTFDIVSLRHSLRRFNLVQIPSVEREVLFRYWDPRVMRVFLDIATRKQRAKMFELIDQIEAADGSFHASENTLSVGSR
jgi:hypothetical protein